MNQATINSLQQSLINHTFKLRRNNNIWGCGHRGRASPPVSSINRLMPILDGLMPLITRVMPLIHRLTSQQANRPASQQPAMPWIYYTVAKYDNAEHAYPPVPWVPGCEGTCFILHLSVCFLSFCILWPLHAAIPTCLTTRYVIFHV